ncbi:MAG TPA: glycoside hydrolase domain-containing protein, partial [Planctomycetota bacterium]|nr:glycoside hydrolase domain-containing protein [Planctomycetota bacterium]
MTDMRALGIILAMAWCVLASSPREISAQEVKPFLISGFEPGEGAAVESAGTAVREHATEGGHSMRIESTPQGYPGIAINDRTVLAKFTDYVLLKVDVYNPQDVPVKFGVRVDDAKSNSYGTRYNDDGVVAAPGRSTLELNLTGLTRSMARNFLERDRLDVSQLRLFSIFMHPRKDKQVLYFDNLRLEGSGLPKVDGLRAFDFGPSKSAVYPGFEQVHERMTWDAERGFGWINPTSFRRLFTPDDLGCDFGRGDEFRVKLPNGSYEVNLQIDVMGEWGGYYHYNWRRLKLNGREVLSETVEPDTFMNERYYLHEDDEDLPGVDVWEKFIAPINQVRRYTAEVTDGMLRLALTSDHPMGQTMTFMVVYPEAQADAGREWLATLDKVRRERFKNAMAIGVPPKPENVTPPARGRGLGYVFFGRSTAEDIPVTYVPTQPEIGRGVLMLTARGERAQGQFGIYPLVDVAQTMRLTVSDLKSADGSVIPASAVRLRKVRNFLKRIGPSAEGRILPYILEDFDTLDVPAGVTRGVWMTVTVPETLAAGTYRGTVKIAVRGHPVTGSFPVTLEVFPFKLERARSITLSVTGTRAAPWRGWFPGFEEKWWEQADLVMKDLADHGMNAVTGGPGARLKAVENGKPIIDYADMDRWLALAVKHGLTHPGDSYQGLAIHGVPQDQSRDCMKLNEQASQKQFGVSHRELI